jgi:hypothetical protein
MSSTLVGLSQSCLCALAFALYLLPCGYLSAYASNIQNFRGQSNRERFLWTLALALPVAIVVAELLGRILPVFGVQSAFFALLVTAIILCIRTWRPSLRLTREQRIIAIVALILCSYLLLTLLDIKVGNKLFVPTTFTDWGVRVPLTWSAIRGPVPPLNPLFAFEGHPAPLRYYYFWYVLCAQPAHLLHAPPDAALASSSVWAALAMLAVFFLLTKYFVQSSAPLHRRCLILLIPMFVIGLDILPTLGTYLHHGSHPYLDIEWWHDDRTPGLLTALLYAPHHIAGPVSCLVAYLALVVEPRKICPLARLTFGQGLARACIAGIAFAACVGTSTFVAFIFVLASLLWTIDLIRTRNWPSIGTLAGSGVIAYLISRVYLRELRSSSSAAHGFAGFAWRQNQYVNASIFRHHLFAMHPAFTMIGKQAYILLLDFSELGFLVFVFAYQLRHRLLPAMRGKCELTGGERALWSIFFAAVATWFFLSSGAATLSGNDLGSHAGILLRFVLVLWAPEYLLHLRESFRAKRRYGFAPRFAILCLALGLVGSLFDAVWHRIYFPLLDAHLVARPVGTFMEPDHLSERFLNIRSMWRELDAKLPANAIVQSYPFGAMRMITTRFSLRQLAAADDGCGTAFGGDHTLCRPIEVQLRHLYDDEDKAASMPDTDLPARPETLATVQDFLNTCRSEHLDAVIVDMTDRVWNQPGSWVWNMQPLVSEPTVRAYACPAN